MKKIKKEESKEENNKINQFFLFNNLESEDNISESFFYLKGNLLSLEEIAKDNLSMNLILQLYLYHANLLMKGKIKDLTEKKFEIILKEILNILKNHDTFRYFLYNNRIDDKTLLKIIP